MVTGSRTRPDDALFDESMGYDGEPSIRLAPGLSEQEQQQAITLYRLFNELWGVIIVVGDPGSGKDTFGNWLAYTLKRFFPHKRVLRDERPRRLFGEYAGLFNEQVLLEDLQRMRDAAKGVATTKVDAVMEAVADDWAKGHGQVLLKHSVLYLTEYWRYCYNREPHNPMNKTMGGIHKMKRHLDCLIIGTVQLPTELDKKTCLPWVDRRVTCVRSRTDSTRYTYLVEAVRYDRRMDQLTPVGRPFAIPLDAGKPRSFIGDGRITILRPNYKPETEEERVVLDGLKLGADRYEDLVALLETDGGMEEWEILLTLKRLCLKLPASPGKFVIDYPCYYRLFNSKSAPQMRTTLKAVD